MIVTELSCHTDDTWNGRCRHFSEAQAASLPKAGSADVAIVDMWRACYAKSGEFFLKGDDYLGLICHLFVAAPYSPITTTAITPLTSPAEYKDKEP